VNAGGGGLEICDIARRALSKVLDWRHAKGEDDFTYQKRIIRAQRES
jgi:hypothetical protein